MVSVFGKFRYGTASGRIFGFSRSSWHILPSMICSQWVRIWVLSKWRSHTRSVSRNSRLLNSLFFHFSKLSFRKKRNQHYKQHILSILLAIITLGAENIILFRIPFFLQNASQCGTKQFLILQLIQCNAQCQYFCYFYSNFRICLFCIQPMTCELLLLENNTLKCQNVDWYYCDRHLAK